MGSVYFIAIPIQLAIMILMLRQFTNYAGHNFMRFIIFAILMFGSLSCGNADSIQIGSSVLRLPEGWVVLKDKRDCFVGELGINGGFRNPQGTTWVGYTILPDETMEKLLKEISHWKILERGRTSGCDYLIVVRPEKEQSPFIILPQHHTYFSIMLTENGNTDETQTLRYWKPPEGEKFVKALTEIKNILFGGYSAINPDATKSK